MDKSVTKTEENKPVCDCAGGFGSICLIVFLLAAFTVFGYLGNELRHQHIYMKCPDYETKYAKWVGYVSFNHAEVRCFWVENEYPRRVRDVQRIRHGLTE